MAEVTLESLDARVAALEEHQHTVQGVVTKLTGRAAVSHVEPIHGGVQVRGDLFTAESTVLVDGQAADTKFVSATALRAPVTAAVGATVQIAVRGADKVVSNTVPWVVVETPAEPGELAPVLTSLSPATAVVGSANPTVHIMGTGFTAESVLVWNGTDDTSVYVSPTELTTLVDMTTVTGASTVPVKVRNGDNASNELSFAFTAV